MSEVLSDVKIEELQPAESALPLVNPVPPVLPALRPVQVARLRNKAKRKNGQQTKWIVERGSAVVKIYLTPRRKVNYYTISYWAEGKRKREVFKTLQAAKDVAATKATQMTKGDLRAAKLTDVDCAAYLRATALLESVGVPLELAASEYASAAKRLGEVSLSQAVDFYLKRHPVHLAPKMVREVVDELLKLKESDGLSARYRQQLAYHLERFADRFCCRVGDVTGTDIDAWLRDLDLGPRSRNNLRNSIKGLFNFAVARKYLPKDHDEMDAVGLAKDSGGEIEIFTPREMAELLTVATPAQLPFLAIGAFAGVRHAELLRLDWAQVRRTAQVIEIRAETAKTASRRVIPVLPNLRKWLAPYWAESGKVSIYANMVEHLAELAQRVTEARQKWSEKNGGKFEPFKWKHNALRHSFISYRVAQTQNVAQVALEAGNSPQMIFQHYRELVPAKEGREWFAIMPGKGTAAFG